MPQNNNAPLRTPAPAPVYNPDSGGSHMDVSPLDPRQGAVIDMTVPQTTDTTLPNPNPSVQQPMISPIAPPDSSVRSVLPTVAPGEYKSNSTGVTRT